MREEIINNLDNPGYLEKLYREHKPGFKKEFNNIYDAIKDNKIALFWNERLNYESEEISWGKKNELIFVLFISLIAGLIARFPFFIGVNEEPFFMKNVSFIVFPFLAIYISWKNNISKKTLMMSAVATLLSILYINFFFPNDNSDTFDLACIHLPLFLWTIFGFTYVGNDLKDPLKRIEFLRFNGDLIVMTTLIVIAAGILTGVTIGLFSLIGLNIRNFYFEYIVVFGLPIAPIFGSFLIQTNPHLVSKVSPIIAKIFSPLVLVMLIIYLIAIVLTGKDPYNDREFLIIFNGLLIGVMALILFSISESSRSAKNNQSMLLLFLLSVVTIIINSIALSAIIFRIMEFGITPNRLAVFGGNILILTNLLLVTINLFKSIKKPEKITDVEKSIANFLPVYSIWTIIVIFIFPLLFSFK